MEEPTAGVVDGASVNDTVQSSNEETVAVVKSEPEPGENLKPQDRFNFGDERVFFAWQRNHMANERTFLSWCRTGISLIVFGFVIERFDILIREIRFFSTSGNHVPRAHYLGLVTFGLGAMIVVVAGWRFFYIRSRINRGEVDFLRCRIFFSWSRSSSPSLGFFSFLYFFFEI